MAEADCDVAERFDPHDAVNSSEFVSGPARGRFHELHSSIVAFGTAELKVDEVVDGILSEITNHEDGTGERNSQGGKGCLDRASLKFAEHHAGWLGKEVREANTLK